MATRFYRSLPHNPADLKTIMTAEPMTQEAHAQMLKKRTAVRRRIEDAREAELVRQGDRGYGAR